MCSLGGSIFSIVSFPFRPPILECALARATSPAHDHGGQNDRSSSEPAPASNWCAYRCAAIRSSVLRATSSRSDSFNGGHETLQPASISHCGVSAGWAIMQMDGAAILALWAGAGFRIGICTRRQKQLNGFPWRLCAARS